MSYPDNATDKIEQNSQSNMELGAQAADQRRIGQGSHIIQTAANQIQSRSNQGPDQNHHIVDARHRRLLAVDDVVDRRQVQLARPTHCLCFPHVRVGLHQCNDVTQLTTSINLMTRATIFIKMVQF